MNNWIDISLSVSEKTTTWPESRGYKAEEVLSFSEGSEAQVSQIHMDVHTGTHIDAERHFLEDGNTLEAIPLERLIGKCYIIDCGDAKVISKKQIELIPEGTEKVLFKTSNSLLWDNIEHSFKHNFVGLNQEGAEALAMRGIHLVGVDYLSIQGFYESNDTHRTLLRSSVVLLEGINLQNVNQGWYELYCLPIKLANLEAAPCRALLKKI